MEKNESDALTQPVAVALIRGLSGSPGYPFHAEGEARAAAVLAESVVSVEHARAVVEEFEADFPSLEQIRSAAFRLKPEFDPAAKVEAAEKRKRDAEDKAAVAGLRNSIPMIPGVRWEVCLQIQCLRIAHQEAYKDQAYYQESMREFPEAMKDLRAEIDPDPAIIERRLRAKNPAWSNLKGLSALAKLDDIAKRVRRDAETV